MLAKYWIFSLLCLLPWHVMAQSHMPGPLPAAQTQRATERISSELTALARTEIRAGNHKRFLQQQQASSLESIPDSFVFDHPPAGTLGQIQQIFWNEPDGLFALVNLGKQHRVLPGHLLRYSKSYPGHEPLSGGVLMILQTFQQQSYALILQANRVPAVNDPIE
ncbi:hypothetical protein LH51_06635 [Nitrincola sp. A-D6]|uniref:hypothetical protein n=1 Tax=Nitrincola sp. A-D6 TaxID=1545442 RepID=UPI00051FA214|nr:hypothetical protein [Nitrincola sp. A-D6]KGK42502.1 hypothetical protein LH51_06635 [Nitrincola sp. A-D6]